MTLCHLAHSVNAKLTRRGVHCVMPRMMLTKMDSRLNVPVPSELLEAIDEWRRRHPALPARATAARMLIEAALKADGVTAGSEKAPETE